MEVPEEDGVSEELLEGWRWCCFAERGSRSRDDRRLWEWKGKSERERKVEDGTSLPPLLLVSSSCHCYSLCLLFADLPRYYAVFPPLMVHHFVYFLHAAAVNVGTDSIQQSHRDRMLEKIEKGHARRASQ